MAAFRHFFPPGNATYLPSTLLASSKAITWSFMRMATEWHWRFIAKER